MRSCESGLAGWPPCSQSAHFRKCSLDAPSRGHPCQPEKPAPSGERGVREERCSRNARPGKGLVGRAQSETSPAPLENRPDVGRGERRKEKSRGGGLVRLPRDAVIATDKLTRYLLVPQARGDKSAFLAGADYTMRNAEQLLRDLREQILPLDATVLESNKFGQYCEIRGRLIGPNGVALAVRTIWMIEHLSGTTKFVTLIPDR